MKADDPHQFAVCMGTDAMRLCLGIKPRNFSAEEVIRWISLSAATRPLPTGTLPKE